MNEQTFWALVESAKAECDRTSRDEATWQPAVLQRKLEALPPSEIMAFAEIFETLHARAYRRELWAAAYVIEGGCSDDGFMDFRSGLIGLGREAYYDAIRDPRTLIRQPARGVDFSQETMRYAAGLAYEAVTGEELPDLRVDPPEPIGERWDDATKYATYPELARKFGAR
ncbi:DUF4240 domain-containing protein [Sandaracinus amylolyticus]|uniref:DUF4240 domain-containing protein n=1 Tax=Sandaracinus amylolyticus TaxID=927083 RepID=UPI001F46A441|nr:DUF4240 domain-containing protein [Sandaracinus amylolyticus]UJR86627.1 Hypothetical protein I5071_87280 [Sandaracinus amylolyticus]